MIMAKWIKFNINSNVLVKLTMRGEQILREDNANALGRMADKYPYVAPPVDKDGYTKFQMHELMSRLGGFVQNSKLPFATEIRLEQPGETS